MRYLVDTQIIVWAKEDNPKLSTHIRRILQDDANEILVSQLSIIELSIKLKLEKLPNFNVSIESFVNRLLLDGYSLLSIKNDHIFSYQKIPLFEQHRDPFDRLILATALSEELPLITADEKFQLYKNLVEIVWE